MDLFAGSGEVHALGLLGWEDALWTKPITIELLDGSYLTVNLETIRRLKSIARQLSPSELQALASSAESKPNP